MAVVIGGTGVLGGALLRRLGAGRGTRRRRRPQRGARRKSGSKAIEDLGGKATFLAGRLPTSGSSVQALLDCHDRRHGQVDMLVNCAGVNSATPYERNPDDEWHKVVDGSLLTTRISAARFSPAHGRAGGGAILNIGSVTSHLPLSRVFAYSASKAAVLNLTQNVAREFAPQDVRVNVLCPGFFPAEQNRKILDQERVDNIMRHTPMGRFGEPHELVGARSLLLPRPLPAVFITGEAILRRRRLHLRCGI